MSDAAIVRPVYAEKDAGPVSFVLKYKKGTPSGRETGTSANMYLKEQMFYSTMRDEVHPFMPCAKVLGVYKGGDRNYPDATRSPPWELPICQFCIAIEDLETEYDCLSAKVGYTIEDAVTLAKLTARMHAKYWRSPKLEQEWLSAPAKGHPALADGTVVPLWFDGFLQVYLGDPATHTKLWFGLLKDVVGADFCANPKNSTLVDLMATRAREIIPAVYHKLNSRPKTFTHGDLRCENMFRSKTDKTVFRAIDWQTCAACAPGIDFIQLYSGWLAIECYEQLDTIYDAYLSTLYSNCPQAKEYTKAMLVEDFGIGTALWAFALTIPLYGCCKDQKDPDGPIWGIMRPMYDKFSSCLQLTNATENIQKALDEWIKFNAAKTPVKT